MSFDKMNEMQLNQGNDKVPPGLFRAQTTVKSAIRPGGSVWEPHKEEIKHLYLTMGQNLASLMSTFEAKYNFIAR